jgi:RNA polymerase sigma-70 factor (ECF subfamily)
MDVFETYRPMLFGIAYRMLGSAMEAEDILQEAYLRFRDVPLDEVQAPKSYLAKIVTRLCLDHLKSAQAKREAYVGVWLPEPVLTGEVRSENDPEMDSLSMAFLVLLESLSPVERAVFLLREVFEYEYDEIAEMIGKEESACRQLLHRAKQHIQEHRPRYKSTPETQQALLGNFLTAATTGDLQGLMNMLTEDVTWWSDGGGKVKAIAKPVSGRTAVAKLTIGITKSAAPDASVQFANINGEVGVLVLLHDEVHGVLLVDVDNSGKLISGVRFVANPDKLKLPKL